MVKEINLNDYTQFNLIGESIMNEDQMKDLVTRVTKEVAAEIKQAEIDRGISISELREHAKELGGGNLDSAWTISYNTSDNAVSTGCSLKIMF